jgi:hypothetical protein
MELVRGRNLEQYFVDVSFTVSSEGKVSNVSLVDSNVPNKLRRYVTNTLRFSHYRPTFKDGIAVDTDDIRLHQTFSESKTSAHKPFDRLHFVGERAASFGCQMLSRGI